MATYEQLIDAARRADKNGDRKAARRFLELAKEQQPKKSIGEKIIGGVKSAGAFARDFAVGDGDPAAESTGERFGRKTATLMNMGGEALSLGFVGDEAAALADDLVGRGSYDERLAQYRGQEEQMRAEHPLISLGAEVAPAMLLPAVGMAQKGGMLARALKGAAGAGVAGGVYGFNEGEGGFGPRFENAKNVGLISGALGAATPFAVRGVERFLDKRAAAAAKNAAIKNAPDGDALRAMAGPIFQRADQVDLPRAPLAAATQQASQAISPRGVNPGLMPRTAALMDEMTDMATDPASTVKFGELNDLRRMTAAARGDFTNPTDQMGGGIIADAIDNFVDSVDPALSKEISEARNMWSRLRKSELIEEAFMKAENQASGFENGLRVQIRAILNNKKKRAGFTAAEIDAMEQIVRGTKFGNILKKVSKLGFGRGQQTNVLSGTAGTAVFGPASLIAGQAASIGAEALTNKGAQNLLGLVRAGGVPNPASVAQIAPQLPGLIGQMYQAAVPRAAEAYMAR